MPRYRRRYQHEASPTNRTPQTPVPSLQTAPLLLHAPLVWQPPFRPPSMPSFSFFFYPFNFSCSIFLFVPWPMSRSPTCPLLVYNSASPPVCSSRLMQKITQRPRFLFFYNPSPKLVFASKTPFLSQQSIIALALFC
ncbi:hypothetical protein J3F83DRAFT_320364 [Trichoderma novae-zelandiae]